MQIGWYTQCRNVCVVIQPAKIKSVQDQDSARITYSPYPIDCLNDFRFPHLPQKAIYPFIGMNLDNCRACLTRFAMQCFAPHDIIICGRSKGLRVEREICSG